MIGMGPFIPMYQILSKMITNNYQALLESLTTRILMTIQPSNRPLMRQQDMKKKLTALHRRFGEYWRRRETRSIASGGILLWKICSITVVIRTPLATSKNKGDHMTIENSIARSCFTHDNNIYIGIFHGLQLIEISKVEK